MLNHNSGLRKVNDWYHAESAVILGDVSIGAGSSIWFGAVLRGDDAAIRIGRRVNIQDLTMVHPDPEVPLVVDDDVTVGHRAILHCARIGSGTMIGMGATLLSGVEVGENCLVAAGAVVPPGSIIPPGSLVRGVPGKVARALTAEEQAHIAYSVKKYSEHAASFAEQYPEGTCSP